MDEKKKHANSATAPLRDVMLRECVRHYIRSKLLSTAVIYVIKHHTISICFAPLVHGAKSVHQSPTSIVQTSSQVTGIGIREAGNYGYFGRF